MPTLETFLLCQTAIVDERTKAVTAVSIFDGITVTPAPQNDPTLTTPLHVTILLRWLFEPAEFDEELRFRLSVVAPDGKRAIWKSVQPFPKVAQQRHRFLVEMEGVPFAGAGRHTMQVHLLKGKTAKRLGALTYDVTVTEVALH